MKRATLYPVNIYGVYFISIHALVKRATAAFARPFFSDEISIHALVKRATLFYDYANARSLYFNPRPREEGDGDTSKAVTQSTEISIHALVKRATANLYNDYLYFEAKYHISDIFHQ